MCVAIAPAESTPFLGDDYHCAVPVVAQCFEVRWKSEFALRVRPCFGQGSQLDPRLTRGHSIRSHVGAVDWIALEIDHLTTRALSLPFVIRL